MFQSEIAERIGVDRTTYMAYERGLKCYPYEHMKEIANIYNIALDELLDDYHKFIYHNQGKNIKKIRLDLGLEKTELAKALNISYSALQRAEQDTVRFVERNFNKLMEYYNTNK